LDITLTLQEMSLAGKVGVARQISCLHKKMRDAHGFDGKNGFEIAIQGVGGEIAAAKALNVYYPPTVDTFQVGGDVGDHIQVRTGVYQNRYLILRPNDRTKGVFIGVSGRMPNYVVHGWCVAHTMAQERYWFIDPRGRPPFWKVPYSALEEISQLRRMLALGVPIEQGTDSK
jgi:hypothetical protein